MAEVVYIPSLTPLAQLPQATPGPESAAPEADYRFRATYLSVLCWLVAAFAQACAASAQSAGEPPRYRLGIFLGSCIGTGLVMGIVAVLTRRLLRHSNKTANIVFSVGVFVLAGVGALNGNGDRASIAQASAGVAAPTASQRTANFPSGSSASTSDARGGVAPGTPGAALPWQKPAPPAPAPQQQARAARGLFLARQYPAEQAAAGRVIAMIMEDGKPWQIVDYMPDVLNASPAFRQAYATWRAAEIRAGNDPQVTPAELAAITKLHEIRKQLAKYRERNNNRPPALTVISGLPANPLTGRRSLAAAGMATNAHGWSYDESTGTMRIVLPPTGCAGLSLAEGEWPRASR